MRPVLRDWATVRWTSWPARVHWIGRGGTSCGWATHELGGEDSKRRSVIKIDLPEKGSVFAIQVKPSGSLVVRPKVFLLPILRENQLPYPYPQSIDWALPLTTFPFKAREWR